MAGNETSKKNMLLTPLQAGTKETILFPYFQDLFRVFRTAGLDIGVSEETSFFHLLSTGIADNTPLVEFGCFFSPVFAKTKEEDSYIRQATKDFFSHLPDVEKSRQKRDKAIREIHENSTKHIQKLEETIQRKEDERMHICEQMQHEEMKHKEHLAANREKREKIREKYRSDVKKFEKKLCTMARRNREDDADFLNVITDMIDGNKSLITSEEFAYLKNVLDNIGKNAISLPNGLEILNACLSILNIAKELTRLGDERFETKKSMLRQQLRENETNCKQLREQISYEPIRVQNATRTVMQEQLVKTKSLSHRQIFLSGVYGVQNLANAEPVLEKQFRELSEQERDRIYDFIRQNIRKFRTRISRNIRTTVRRRVDIAQTIKASCRTSGVPAVIVYEKPVRTQTRLALFLDVSGSCRKASELMLSFAYLLREVFAGGCLAYAFTNKLHDLSLYFEAGNINDACLTALNSIPRAGAYSDYNRTFQQICKEEISKLTKDTLCIFIGDARNNKNASGEEYLKRICRKCKKSFWLNTDPPSKWNQGDSIIDTYRTYMNATYCTQSPAELLNFLLEFK